MNARASLPSLAPDKGRTLSVAVARIAEAWGLTNAQLGRALGLSPASVSRLRDGAYVLEDGSKPFELGQYLLRLFRGLDALMGSDDDAARAWLRSFNFDLGGPPLERLASISGLVQTCDYVDAFRARV